MSPQRTDVSVGKTYRFTVPGGYGAPDGSRWSKDPFPGGEARPPRTVTGKVRRRYESVTGATCYVVGTVPRSRLDAEVVIADEVIEVVPC